MKVRYVFTILFIALATGCTAYNSVSRGYISDESEWQITHGAGQNFPREATQIRGEGLTARVTPCNYGDKDVYMVLPVPMPLGSIEGVSNKEIFVVGVRLFTNSDQIEFDVSDTNITLNNGESHPPVMYKKEFDSCVKNPYAHSQNAPLQWEEVNEKQIVTSKWMHVSLLFDVAAPDVEDEYALSLQGIKSEGRHINIPVLNFRGGASWGGW